jgi:hypothetical protein
MARPGLFASLRPRALAWPAALLAALAGRDASATACAGPEVRSDAHVAGRWSPAIASLRDELRALRDIDTCGRVSLFGAADAVVVEVALPDGRAATRRVERPEELVAAVGSLLVLPPAPLAPAASPAASPAAPPAALPPVTLPAPAADRPAAALPPARPPTRFEGGLALGVRLSQGYFFGPGLAAFSNLSSGSWLLSAHFRSTFFEVLTTNNPSKFSARSAALSAQLGRRLRSSAVDVDFLAGPALVIEREEQRRPGPNELARDSDVRLVGVVRLVQREASFFGTLDAEISPMRLLGEPHQPNPNLPPLPSWSAGFAVGFMRGLF